MPRVSPGSKALLTKIMVGVAIFFAGVSLLIWVAFLRPVPTKETFGEIKTKTHKPAGTYWQQQVGLNRSFRTATPIPVAESYVLELYCPEINSSGFFAVSPEEQAEYKVGQKLLIEYQQKGLPGIGYKTIVLSIKPHNSRH
jgi:hypothetical protein